MRISLIHGEDTSKSYKRYTELINQSKQRGFEITSIDDVKKIVGQSLFEDKTVFTLDKPNKVKPTDWKWLKENASKYNSNLLIFYEGNAPITVTRNLPKDAKLEKFELPRIIFQFLDSIYPGNIKNSLKLLNDLSKNEAAELVLYLTARHLRDLYWAAVSPSDLNLPPWRKNKLVTQAKRIGEVKLKNMINDLSSIDIKTKTSDENLKDLLDIFVVKHLE